MGRRHYPTKKTEVESLIQLRISNLKTLGYLSGRKLGGLSWQNNQWARHVGLSLEGYEDKTSRWIRLSSGTAQQPLDYHIKLETTTCYFGGVRYWFLCPIITEVGKNCGRRVAVLYKGGDYFGCRYCYNLTYASRTVNRRFPLYPSYQTLILDRQARYIARNTKRFVYAGKPTRQARRVLAIRQRMYCEPVY